MVVYGRVYPLVHWCFPFNVARQIVWAVRIALQSVYVVCSVQTTPTRMSWDSQKRVEFAFNNIKK